MMPVYRFMDPYNGTNVSYNHNHRPSFENFQPHMKGDPVMPPVSYEMPYANNLGYPVMPYSCCSHGYLPSHCGWRNSPPASPYAPPNQFHCCGQHYHAFPESYPIQYVPPPHYTMNLPRYDFDKIVPGEHGYHCCGCPNHAHNKSCDNVKVEEQEPDDERKNSSSLIPVNQLKNNLCPIIWIPPDYLKDKEHVKSDRSEDASRIKEISVRETRPAESQRMNPSISDPRCGVGVPFNLKNLGRLVGDSDGKKAQNHQNQDKKEQLPFPLIWIPYYDNKDNEEETKDNKESAVPQKAEHPDSPTSFFPFKLADGGDKTNVYQAIQDYSIGQVALDERKISGQKSISVRQIEEPKVKANPEDSMKSELKYQDNSVADKVSGTSAKRQPSSPTKTSKLPPVCLRADPLPMKKNGKVASRSPSPPGTKVQQEASKNQSSEHKESHQSFPAQNNNLGSNVNVEAKKKEGKVIPVVERESSESEQQITVTPITDSEIKITMEEREKQTEGVGKTRVAKELVAEEESKTKGATEIRSSDKCEDKAGKKELSDAEAALRIQSSYRGFTVRRWEPLKKLKEIAKVRDKVDEVRNQIQTLESSFDAHKDGRQKLVIGETIMSLLLKLDTIQGLHPSFRDMRKSLARELITLQEKLDMLMVKKSEEMNETKAAENPATDCNGQSKEAEEQSINISSKSESETNQISDPVIAKYENNTSEQEARRLPTADELSIQKEEEDVTEAGAVENAIMKCVPSECEAEASEKSESVETRIVVPDISDGKEQSEEFEGDKSADILTDLKELLQAVIQEESIEQAGTGVTDGEKEPSLVTESPIADDNLVSAKNTLEVNLANELPLGLIVEQDSEKDEMTKIEGNEGLCGEEATDFPASELRVAILDEDELQEGESSELQNEDSGGCRCEVESIKKVEKEDALIDLSEQQSMEPSTEPEMHSVAEPEKVDGNTGHEVYGDMQHPHAVVVNDSCRDVEATKLAGREQVSSAIESESNDELCGGEGGHISVQSHISDAANANLEEDKQTKDEKNVHDEKMSLKEEADALAENLRDANDSVVPKNVEEESDNVSVSSPGYEERDQDTELVLPAPVDSQLSIKEKDIRDKRILEENQQLKEMVEKLLEAGKEQLNVISSLTGRVKELEKKLSRKKKARPASFKVSPRFCGRQSNELQRSRGTGRAM